VTGRGNRKYWGDGQCIPIRIGEKPTVHRSSADWILKLFFDDEEIQNDRFSTGNKSVEAPLHV
jgi:hypothetical protein